MFITSLAHHEQSIRVLRVGRRTNPASSSLTSPLLTQMISSHQIRIFRRTGTMRACSHPRRQLYASGGTDSGIKRAYSHLRVGGRGPHQQLAELRHFSDPRVALQEAHLRKGNSSAGISTAGIRSAGISTAGGGSRSFQAVIKKSGSKNASNCGAFGASATCLNTSYRIFFAYTLSDNSEVHVSVGHFHSYNKAELCAQIMRGISATNWSHTVTCPETFVQNVTPLQA